MRKAAVSKKEVNCNFFANITVLGRRNPLLDIPINHYTYVQYKAAFELTAGEGLSHLF